MTIIDTNKLAFQQRHGIERPTKCVICGKHMATSAIGGSNPFEILLYCSSYSRNSSIAHYQISADGSWLVYMPKDGHPSYRVLTAYRDVSIDEDFIVAQRRSTVIEPPTRGYEPRLILTEPLTIEQHCEKILTAEKIELMRILQ